MCLLGMLGLTAGFVTRDRIGGALFTDVESLDGGFDEFPECLFNRSSSQAILANNA